jgi:hypothetical protein
MSAYRTEFSLRYWLRSEGPDGPTHTERIDDDEAAVDRRVAELVADPDINRVTVGSRKAERWAVRRMK